MVTFVKPYGKKNRVRKDPVGPTRTKQSMRDECNINFIVAKFQQTGAMEHLKKFQGEYGDFGAIDFHEAMNIVAEAKSMFESVPSNIRKQFDNDPGQFVEFATNPDNMDQLIELGLAPRRPPEPEPAPPAPEPPEPPAE